MEKPWIQSWQQKLAIRDKKVRFCPVGARNRGFVSQSAIKLQGKLGVPGQSLQKTAKEDEDKKISQMRRKIVVILIDNVCFASKVTCDCARFGEFTSLLNCPVKNQSSCLYVCVVT